MASHCSRRSSRGGLAARDSVSRSVLAAALMHAPSLVLFSFMHTTWNALVRPILFQLAGLGACDYGIVAVRYAMEFQERIPPGLPLEEVAERIRAQGGIVYAPHPYAYLVRSSSRAARVLAAAYVVEVLNGRAFLPVWNRRARAAAQRLGLREAAGSDGHFANEIGQTWTEVGEFATPAELLVALEQGRVCHASMASPHMHLASLAVQYGKQATRLFNGRSWLARPDPFRLAR